MTDVAERPAAATVPAPQDNSALTAYDRCDRCQAQAYTRWQNEAGSGFLFCGHHTGKYEVDLMTQGFEMVRDEREKLHIKRESSATA